MNKSDTNKWGENRAKPAVRVPFKLFGLQRSGTNLARLLLLRNFEVQSLERGFEWKHGYITPEHRSWLHDNEPVRLIICIKNPYAWLVSCYSYFCRAKNSDPSVDKPFKRTWTFAEFLTRPTYEFKNPVDRWNSLIAHWVEFPAKKEFSEIILHESMLRPIQQKRALLSIAKRQQLVRKHENIIPASRQVTVDMIRRGPFKRAYYRSMQYLDQYSPDLIAFVNEGVSKSLMDFLAYAIVPVDDVVRRQADSGFKPASAFRNIGPHHLDVLHHRQLVEQLRLGAVPEC